MARIVWLVAGALVTAVLLGGGVVLGRIALGNSGQEPAQISRTPFDRPLSMLVLDVDSGDLEVTAGAPGLELSTRGSSRLVLEQRWDGTTLHLTGRCSSGRCSSELKVSVPATAKVEIKTGSADAEITGVSGGLALASRSGDFLLRDVAGSVIAATNTGDITGTGIRAPSLDLRTNTGGVMLAVIGTPRELSALTNSGDLDVTVPPGRYRTLTETISGRTQITVPGDPAAPSSLTLRSNSGDIRLRQLPRTKARVATTEAVTATTAQATATPTMDAQGAVNVNPSTRLFRAAL